ncbi:hypothetical protein ACS0TY_032716 [Phlomoides rotata]
MIDRMPSQAVNMGKLIGGHQIDCYDNLRMDQNAFGRLCILLRSRGLVDGKHMTVDEQVAMFLSILAHHKKNHMVKFNHQRSGQTVSHYVHVVLLAVLKMHTVLFVKPDPVPTDSTNPRWKWFKGTIATNVLAACDRKCMFTYILPRWEGSTFDARVLRDSISRVHGLKVPIDNYYLCDNRYANSPGFLSPYRSVKYHLSEWGPQSATDIPRTL